jgi:3-hydroxyisobutyrate dehydrogenase
MLPSSPHVLSVYKGDNGILQHIKNGALLIDSSTIDPGTAQEVARAALEKKTDLVDAPVSGGVGGAEAGTLTFMVGGTPQQFERASEILKKMGKNIVHCGPSGTGQVAKLCNNLVLAIEMSAVAEGMNLGVKLGMDPKVLASIFNSSTARCWSSDTYNPVPGVMPNVPSSRDYQGGFYSALMLKDLGLARTAAQQAGVELSMGSRIEEIYKTMCEKHGYSQKDFGVIYQYFKEHMTKK